MTLRHHKRSHAGFERTVEGELDRERLLGIIRRLAVSSARTRQNHQAQERGQHAPDGNGLTCAHLATPGPDRLVVPCGRF
jgi:hypothetical protein